MSSVSWLRAYDGADLRDELYGKQRKWVQMPQMGAFNLNQMRATRAPSLAAAQRNNQDWTFEQQDCGGFSMILDGTAASKDGFFVMLGSDMADAFGFAVIVNSQGAVAVRNVVGEYGPFAPPRERLATAPGVVRAVRAPLQRYGPVAFTVLYQFGEFRMYEGGDANNPGRLLVSYSNPQPGMGNYKWSIGLLGPANGDYLIIDGIKKWNWA